MHSCHVASNDAIRRIFVYHRWNSIRIVRQTFGYQDLSVKIFTAPSNCDTTNSRRDAPYTQIKSWSSLAPLTSRSSEYSVVWLCLEERVVMLMTKYTPFICQCDFVTFLVIYSIGIWFYIDSLFLIYDVSTSHAQLSLFWHILCLFVLYERILPKNCQKCYFDGISTAFFGHGTVPNDDQLNRIYARMCESPNLS